MVALLRPLALALLWPVAASSADAAVLPSPPPQAGAALALDGVDDFFAAFPAFQLDANWTVEAWVQLDEVDDVTEALPQCIFQSSTYSGASLFSLALAPGTWQLSYGAVEVAVERDASAATAGAEPCSPAATDCSGPSSWSPAAFRRPPAQRHVAVAHELQAAGGEATLTLFVDGVAVFEGSFAPPATLEPALTLLVGACSAPERRGLVRGGLLRGAVDEVRHWSTVRSEAEVRAAMNLTGDAAQWPADVGDLSSLAAQYCFDDLSDEAITDTSGKGNHGSSGIGWFPGKAPAYRRSPFGLLRGAPRFVELLASPAGGSGAGGCPSPRCLDLRGLLLSDLDGEVYNALLVRELPALPNVTLSVLGSSDVLAVGDLVIDPRLEVLGGDAAVGRFALQLCRGTAAMVPTVAQCVGQPVETFDFRLHSNRAPMAGEGYSLRLFGDSGYLQLREHLAESGTVEFWLKLEQTSGRQTLFSISRRDVGRPGWKLDIPALALSLLDGVAQISLCTAPIMGVEETVSREVPFIATLEAQHLAVSWRYLGVARGRAVYEITVYQNCHIVAGPLRLEDVCAIFGYSDSDLHYPTFGQQFGLGPLGLAPGAFANAHLGELRLWSRPRSAPELCSGMGTRLSSTAPGLQAHFPMGPDDAHGSQMVLANKVAAGPPADLRCSSMRVACPAALELRGYVLEPSVFELPVQPVTYVTTAGDGHGSALPPLAVAAPATDADALADWAAMLPAAETVAVQVRSLPAAACGTLLLGDALTPASLVTRVPAAQLPFLFRPFVGAAGPDAAACTTSFKYVAVDSAGVESPSEAEVKISVRVPGPRIAELRAVERRRDGAGGDAGDVLLLRFEGPTSRRTDWRDWLTVVNGSLGLAELIGTWDETGSTLSLELAGELAARPRLVARGRCLDAGLRPLPSLEACEAAVIALGIGGAVAAESAADRPEGCYVLNGIEPFFNDHALSEGKGSETSSPGFSRLPVCSSLPFRMEPGVARVRLSANFSSPLTSASGQSFPIVDLSPTLVGSWEQRYCPNGTVFSFSKANCTSCPSGSFQSTDGLRCDACPPGTAAGQPEMTSCEACALGKFMPPGSAQRDVCFDAGPGQYVDSIGSTRAFDCPRGAVVEESGRSGCERCPDGASCEVLQDPRPKVFAVPQAEYFRTVAGEIVPCTLPLACLGWDLTNQRNHCAEGMEGYLCQGCQRGFWRPTDRTNALCEPCAEERQWAMSLRFVGMVAIQSAVVWLIAVMSVDAACWGNMHAVFLRLALNYFSVSSVLSRLERWEFERALGVAPGAGVVGYISGIVDVALRFDGGMAAPLMGLECWFGSDGQWMALQRATVLWAIMPLLWPLALLLVGLVVFEAYTWYRRLVWKLRNQPVKVETAEHLRDLDDLVFMREPRLLGLLRLRAARAPWCMRWKLVVQDCTPLIVVAQFLILPTVLRQLAVVVACDQLASPELRLFVAPEVLCWTGSHAKNAAVAICAVVLWGMVVPILLMLYLWRHRQLLVEDVRFRSRFGFISDGYERNWVWWECVVYGRKMLIIAVSALPNLTRPAELAMYQVIGVAAMLLHYAAKPFDNRCGEMFDRVELYGLCFFLLLVTFMQVVLLADPLSEYDLLPVLLACTLLGMASVVMETHTSPVRFYASLSLAGFFVISSAMYWITTGPATRQRTALLILGFGVVMNVGYIIWLFGQVLKYSVEALAELLGRWQQDRDKTYMKAAAKDAVQVALRTKHMLNDTVPYGSLFTKPVMPPNPSRSLAARFQRALMDAHFDNMGAAIWFDCRTRELVLGLHPDNFAREQRISNYQRRKLAASGPFLSDEDRRYVALALREALMHLIVDCDQNTVHCSLLELLIRAAFVYHYRQERESREGPGRSEEQEESAELFVEACFNEETFTISMTAADFSGHLGKLSRIPGDQVAVLVEVFLRYYRPLEDEVEEDGVSQEPDADVTASYALDDQTAAASGRQGFKRPFLDLPD